MKLIKPSVEILVQQPGIQGMYDMIELCGKTSYKSEPKGGKTAEDFVSARVNEGHYAVLEFGTVYLSYPSENIIVKYDENPYSHIHLMPDGNFAVTTNLRVLVEKGWTLDLQYWCEPTEYHCRRYTAKVITDRATSMEFIRHRVFSFCQESTRYCNYSSDKFGNELTCIVPDKENWKGLDGYYLMLNCLDEIERVYMQAIKDGVTPQIARGILPNCLKTEICVCGDEGAWDHFFALRYYGLTGKPHPDMHQVAHMLLEAFKEKGVEF